MTSQTWQQTSQRSKAHGPSPSGKERPSVISKDSRNTQQNIPQSDRYTPMSCMEIAVSATRMVGMLQEAAKHRAFRENAEDLILSIGTNQSATNKIYINKPCKPACCQSNCETTVPSAQLSAHTPQAMRSASVLKEKVIKSSQPNVENTCQGIGAFAAQQD